LPTYWQKAELCTEMVQDERLSKTIFHLLYEFSRCQFLVKVSMLDYNNNNNNNNNNAEGLKK